ncbi:uncharacterized protein LOC106158303 [Lingula anatina]|uniref:Uncharacterized protein LOC106158303 n=1 Tax=Lingula anatina TaxID=7574 RepID=A0A1S3HX84_LINAN|nr:uncharacterized protein LOC106158303 [Lingula anatina]|eukprot:XP_013389674.1 uncharacterized protein LOC106158303 [Lingula anatina]
MEEQKWLNLIKPIQEACKEKRLHPSRELVNVIASRPMALQGDAEALLLKQVALSRERDAEAWRKDCAKGLLAVGFQSCSWVCEHVARVATPRKGKGTREAWHATYRDFRLQEDPTMEHRKDTVTLSTVVRGSPEAAVRGESEESGSVSDSILRTPTESMEVDTPSSPVRKSPRATLTSWGSEMDLCEKITYAEAVKKPSPSGVVVTQSRDKSSKTGGSYQPRPKSRVWLVKKTKDSTTRQDAPPKGPSKFTKKDEEKRCFRCKKVGHVARKCPTLSEEERCFRCSELGHIVKDCPLSRKAAKDRKEVSKARRDDSRGSSSGRRDDSRGSSSYKPATSGLEELGTWAHAKRSRQSSSSSHGGVTSAVATGISAPSPDLCPIFGCNSQLTEKHAWNKHIPPVFHPVFDGKGMEKRRFLALNLLATQLFGMNANMDRLCQACDVMDQGDREIAPSRKEGVDSFIHGLGLSGEYALRVGSLLLWKPLLSLIAKLWPSDLEAYRNTCSIEEEEELSIPKPPVGYDSHCHVDRVRQHLELPTTAGLREVIEAKQVDDKEITVSGATVIFCDPATYPSAEEVASLKAEGAVVSVGWHPRHEFDPEGWAKFEQTVSNPEVSVLGEIGVDYTTSSWQWEAQFEVLERALTLLREDQVLVLHCRGPKDDSAGDLVWRHVLNILRLAENVKSDQLIHCHCFTGSRRMVEKWVQYFPNTYFGATAIFRTYTDTSRSRRAIEMLQWMPAGRLLLETDAPYFGFPTRSKSTPAFLGKVAEVVAKIRGCDWEDILKITEENGRRLYLDRLGPSVE